jgi:hypothetical protein
VAPVRNLTLRRDVATFQLDSGTLTLLTPVGGGTVGAVYVGSGRVSFLPPLAIERDHMRRVLAESSLAAPIRSAVFLFADSTLAELQRSLTFAAGTPDPQAGDRVGDALDFLLDRREKRTDDSFMDALLNNRQTGYFAAYVRREHGEDLMVRIASDNAEPVQLLRRGRQQQQRVETVSQFALAQMLRDTATRAEEPPGPVRADAYRIAVRIGDNYEFSATAMVRLIGHDSGTRWVRFLLFGELEVDSVVSDAGGGLSYFRAAHSPELWIRLDTPLAAAETRWLRVGYHGRLITWGSVMQRLAGRRMPRPDQWSFILSDYWYPLRGSPADLDVTFTTPRDLKVVCVGRLTESRTEGATHVTRWVTERPVRLASFNVGVFRELAITDPRIPPVTVLVNEDAHIQVRAALPHSRNPAEHVGADIANSLSFFSTRFGAPLFSRYTASEIPYSHGVAYPGLMHLSWFTFLGLGTNGSDESFRAHEMAHQWWGVGVEPASYRDWWLAEGFAEFSGLWYMQLILGSNDNYFKQLRESRQEIHRTRERSAPLGLGLRAAENTAGNYSLVVYQKGAWVLQMLRNMALDLRTMSDDRFGTMLRDFYETYRGRRASTRDFQRVVERHFGASMDWFFQQWVERTAIPTYVLSWHTAPIASGRHRLRLRVRQEDVPDDFFMPVPLLVELEGGDEALLRLNVRGPLTDTEVELPAVPRRLELNPLESVLAQVRTERWRDSASH